jgi:hypothetical protein
LLRNDASVQQWATDNGISLTGTRFREYEPFAAVGDLEVAIDIDPVTELTPTESCTEYEAQFMLHVGYTGSGSSRPSDWLRVLEQALMDTDAVWAPCLNGNVIMLRDFKFLGRPAQVRLEEAWILRSDFRCLAVYAE